ncbi:MAG: hypothetical protein R3197_05950 [Paracoccaceae bacterium]|jgi:hypothetical protein|nr:hypothetical protein [Paracoccaceae bacterium]
MKRLILPVTLVAALWPPAMAVAAEEETQEPAPGLAAPLGPWQTSVPVSLPTERNAFPAEILTRMRAALAAQAANPVTRSGGHD